MEISQLRKLIREEVRKSLSPSKKRKLHEAVKPVALDSSITANLVFFPYDDITGLSEYIFDSGALNNAIFVTEGPKTGIIVLKEDVGEANEYITKYEEEYM